MGERKETPQDRYAKKYKKTYLLACFSSTEQDIIDRLESEQNKSGYIKSKSPHLNDFIVKKRLLSADKRRFLMERETGFEPATFSLGS